METEKDAVFERQSVKRAACRVEFTDPAFTGSECSEKRR